MVTTTAGRTVPALPALAVGRPLLFALTMLVLVANAIAAKMIEAVTQTGPLAAALNGLGLSWAFWFAYAVCIRLALKQDDAPARPRDLWVCAACLVASLVPLSPLAAFACGALAAAVLLDRTQGAFLKGSAMVLLAISVQLFWSRVLMLFFLQPVANIDAHLVSFLISRPVQDNNVQFADGSGLMSILGPCTSVQNASIALVLYVAIVRAFRPVPQRAEVLGLAGVFLSVVALNIARLALMAQSIPMYHLLHGELGWNAINAVITLTGLAWAVASVRREVFN